MRLRNRLNQLGELELCNTLPTDLSDGPTPGNLNVMRQAGEALLDAADDAIDRALSGHSLEYLAQNRQEGGQ